MFRRHPLLSLTTVCYLAVVGWVTLGPQPLNTSNDSWLYVALRFFSQYPATRFITYDRVEFTANIAMFVPLGVLFLLLFGRPAWLRAFLGGVALTCLIEFLQLFLPGRVSDIRDIIANSTGALLGVVVALMLTAFKARAAQKPHSPRAAAS